MVIYVDVIYYDYYLFSWIEYGYNLYMWVIISSIIKIMNTTTNTITEDEDRKVIRSGSKSLNKKRHW